MQKKWLEQFCKYRHIYEFLGNEGKEKKEIKEYLMLEWGLPEATARYQMLRALEDEDGIAKNIGWKFYLDEEKFKTVIEDLRSIYPIRVNPYPVPPKEEIQARVRLIEIQQDYKKLEQKCMILQYRYLSEQAKYFSVKSEQAGANGDRNVENEFFQKMDEALAEAVDLQYQLEEQGIMIEDEEGKGTY